MTDAFAIATSFLRAAPPGEFTEVYADVMGILGDQAYIFNAEAKEEAHRNYNIDQMVAVETTDGHKVLLSEANHVSGNTFFDGKTVQVHEVDPIAVKITSSAPSDDHDNDVEPWRSALFSEVETYVNNYYPQGVCAVTGSKQGSVYVLTIGISAHLFNPRSYYNGRWRSVWTVKFNPGGSADLTGKIRANVHFFEGGNVQLKTDADKSKKGIPAQNAQQLAQNVAGSLGALEGDWQNQFENLFETMGDTTYKALRRPLPMDCRVIGPRWGMIHTYKLGGDLGK